MIIADLLACAVEFFCILIVLSAFFPRRDHSWYTQCTALLCGVFHVYLSTSGFALTIRMPLVLLIGFLACEACFQGKRRKKIFVLLIFWAITYAIDISVLTICMAVQGSSAQAAVSQNSSYLFSMLSARSLLLSVSFGCGYIVKRQEQKQEGSMLWLCLVLIPVYTIMGTGALISNAMNGGTLSGGIVALSGGLLCINVLLCVVVNKLEQHRQAEEEKRKLQAEANHNLQLAKTYQDSFAHQRKITHEFRNQLDAISGLLARQEYDRAANFVNHLQYQTQEVVPLIHTNHPMVDAVLNQKYQLATQMGIGMQLYCNDMSAIPLEDGDLVTLLGNILDNAIVASAKTHEKQVWVHLWQEQNIFQLVVRNSFSDAPLDRGDQERVLHGFGTGLVAAVLDKYGYPYYADQIGDKYVFSTVLD